MSMRALSHIAGPLALAAAAILAAPGALPAQEQPLRVAVVDLDVLVARSARGKALQERLDKFQKDVQTEGEGMAAKAQEIRKRMEDGQLTLSEERLTELNKEYEDAMIALRRFRDDKQREGKKIQDEALREIERELEPVFEQVRQEMGFDLILNRVPGVVLMVGERLDITPLMLERFNSGPPAGGN